MSQTHSYISVRLTNTGVAMGDVIDNQAMNNVKQLPLVMPFLASSFFKSELANANMIKSLNTQTRTKSTNK